MRNLTAPVPGLEESTSRDGSENELELPLCILGPGGNYRQSWPMIQSTAARDATVSQFELEDRSAAFGWRGFMLR